MSESALHISRTQDMHIHERCPPPKTVADTGVEFNALLRLLLKTAYVRGLETDSQFGEALRLPLSVTNELLEGARERGLVEVLGSAGRQLHTEFRYGMTERGREWSVDALHQSRYVGPAPVSLEDYHRQVARQRVSDEHVARNTVAQGLSDLVISDNLIHQLGPAINSARTILLYGAAGNGKTTIAEIIGRVFRDIIHVPYCLDVDGQTIKVFDPAIHDSIEDEQEPLLLRDQPLTLRSEELDRRWVACHRPTAIAGGELTLSMLDLQFNPHSRFYEAPMHLKAIGGTFVIDDLGRQLIRPEDLLNRWIGPMENRVDYLTLSTGRTFDIPFDVMLVFSTNLLPEDLMDPAFLRRIPYKIGIKPPSEEQFLQTLQQECTAAALEYEEGMGRHIIHQLQGPFKQPLAFYQPKFLVNQIKQMCQFEGRMPELDSALISESMMHLAPRSDLVGMERFASHSKGLGQA